jgi:hypothetical protein
MIERDHKLFVDALSKMINGGLGNWVDNLFAVLWADRFIVRRSIGYIPFYFFCGRESVLFIEFEVSIWRIFLWDEVYDTVEFLVMRVRQI